MQVAVLGAGPVGLEAARCASDAGHDVVVYEAGTVGDAVRRWGHVTLFTPWSLVTTPEGRARVRLRVDPEATPTGAELVQRYLEPLAATLDVRTHHRVPRVGRPGLRKGDALAAASRAEAGFVLLLDVAGRESLARADAILDCTGTFGQPLPAGVGGLPAPGEAAAAAAGRVRYGPVRVEGHAAAVVGAGASGTTVVCDLVARGTTVAWLTGGEAVPAFYSDEDDALPARRALFEAGARAAGAPGVEVIGRDAIVAFEVGERLGVHLDSGRVLTVDVCVVCTGFRPDHSLSRELQVHVCWGSEGPMKLAAALLAQGGGGGDCLAAEPLGPETLRSPEPAFFVIGAKSYGRRSDFLLRTGYVQARDAVALLGSRSPR